LARGPELDLERRVRHGPDGSNHDVRPTAFPDDDVRAGRFDPMQMVASSSHAPRKSLHAIPVRERAFLPTELVLMCGLAGQLGC